MSHSLSNILIHVVLSTKIRQLALDRNEIREELYSYIAMSGIEKNMAALQAAILLYPFPGAMPRAVAIAALRASSGLG